jgi:ABC-type antimicrobial peptide transport system permease subunit
MPPKYALNFLRWFCREDYVEEIEGDLTEVFEKDYEHSPRFANWKFNWSVIRYLRPQFLKSFKRRYYPNPIDMFRHNFLISIRSFKRYKTTFFINLFGLSSGLACALLIYLWVKDELSVDKFHDRNVYEAMLNHHEAGRIHTANHSPALLAKAMHEEIPEVDMAVTDTDPAWFGDNFTVSDGELNVKMPGKFSSADYFKMFSFEFVQGDRQKALDDKSAIVVSEKLAKSLFPNTNNVVGKSVEWNLLSFNGSATIAGVFRDIPSNSTDRFDFVLPFQVFENMLGKDAFHWGNYNAITFVRLKDGSHANAINEKISGFIKKKADWSNVTLFVRPFSDRYLYNNYDNGVLAGGRISYVTLFSMIAIFIVFIACINFMNLATARATRRTKEVGIKKVVGAARKDLIFQYMGESILVTITSLVVAVGFVLVFLPEFNDITGKQLTLDIDQELIIATLAITLFTGILSGSYPALYLSGFNPIAVLKGRLSSSFGELVARKGLVIFQFVLSILLIVSVVVVYNQIDYIQHKNLGYSRENVITFPNEGKAIGTVDVFLEELKKTPGVANAAASAHDFSKSSNYTTDVSWEGKNPDDHIRFGCPAAYYDLIETFGIEMKEGRTFSRAFNNEGENVILNETAVKVMGLKDPVGKTIKLWGSNKQIIGVMKDFHFASLHEKVEPFFFRFDPQFLPSIVVKIKAGEEQATLAGLTEFYKAFNPGYTLSYQFSDQIYQLQYTAEMRVALLSRYFAGLAIVISCLGLFGLATFTSERRLKEIGIRKVLGASEMGIIYLLSSDFTKMVLMAIVVALPISYFITAEWLKTFAYRTDIEWWFFVNAGAASLLIAWFTIGMQTFKAAKVNPAKCLRNE